MHLTIAEPVAIPRTRTQFLRELAQLRLPNEPDRIEVVSEAMVAAMPHVVQRYLRFMQVPSRPRVWSFLARSTGTFRRTPTEAFTKCEAWQFNSRLGITRVFYMHLRLRGVVPVVVRDTYVACRGRMLGRVFDKFSIVDASDEKIATGELVTYLNDALCFAPSMLIGPDATWTDLDETSFAVSLHDGGRTVRALVEIDGAGAMRRFTTTDRFGTDPARPGEMVRARWSTTIGDYKIVNARPVPVSAAATWHFDSGDFTYGELRCAELHLNIT